MGISEDARAMKFYIEEHGWTKGTIGSSNGPACIVGSAIHSDILDEDDYCWYEYPVIEAIGERIGIRPISITGWNDAPERTREDVLDVLEDVAIKYDTDEFRSGSADG